MKKYLRQLVLCYAFMAVIALSWVGAEYVVEGVVEYSKVDNAIAIILSAVLGIVVEEKIWGDK